MILESAPPSLHLTKSPTRDPIQREPLLFLVISHRDLKFLNQILKTQRCRPFLARSGQRAAVPWKIGWPREGAYKQVRFGKLIISRRRPNIPVTTSPVWDMFRARAHSFSTPQPTTTADYGVSIMESERGEREKGVNETSVSIFSRLSAHR